MKKHIVKRVVTNPYNPECRVTVTYEDGATQELKSGDEGFQRNRLIALGWNPQYIPAEAEPKPRRDRAARQPDLAYGDDGDASLD